MALEADAPAKGGISLTKAVGSFVEALNQITALLKIRLRERNDAETLIRLGSTQAVWLPIMLSNKEAGNIYRVSKNGKLLRIRSARK